MAITVAHGQAYPIVTTTVPSTGSKVACALHGAESADDLLDSIVFIWAAVERCGRTHDALHCAVDVSYAIESVNHMINTILKAVQKCGVAFQGAHAKCGLAVGELTESFAGIAAVSSGIVEHCPPNSGATTGGPAIMAGRNTVNFPHKFAHCIVDMKSLVKAILKATLRLVTLKDNCQDNPQGRYCARNVLQVVGAFAGMGEFIAGAVGHCSQVTNQNAACASEIIGLLRQLSNLGKAGTTLSKECALSEAERLYLDTGDDDLETETTGSNFMNMGLTALIPVTAVLSFVVGRRIAKGRGNIESQSLEASAEE